MEVKSEQNLRQVFKSFNKFMLMMWRLGLGKLINFAPATVGRIMVLVHVGRKTGTKRQTPVNYTVLDGEIYCVAGYGAAADWYRNILKQPKVEVWLPEGWWQGVARDVSDHPRRMEIMREVLIASGFAAQTFAGINVKTISDADLAAFTQSYRLIHIHRSDACTGPGGPGDLAWVWPVATFILLPLALRKRH